MNINSTVSSSLSQKVKYRPGHDSINDFPRDLIEQNEEYEQEIIRLKKTHDEQICKLCNELDKSSSLIHRYKLDLDSMRLALNLKEKQLKNKTNDSSSSSNQDLQTKNSQLIIENRKLKKELAILSTKYQTLFHEMQDARQYVLKMIAKLN